MKNNMKVKELFGACGCGKLTEGSAGVLCCAEDWKGFKEDCLEEIDDYCLNRVKRSANSETYLVTNSYLGLKEHGGCFKFCAIVVVTKNAKGLFVGVKLFSDFRMFLEKKEDAYWHFCATLEKATQGFGCKSAVFSIDVIRKYPQIFKAKVFPYERSIASGVAHFITEHNGMQRLTEGRRLLFLSRQGVVCTIKKIYQKRKELVSEHIEQVAENSSKREAI
ncbi:MAG: hypothetical protein A2231_11505 [Candidatus Firestonebacteria bacterium RIFOXYA2_FULL_40_8]|nr:MAG: hypothetical protein A2231_11505 [Candidatus Firestonebacteria bacterium RIFOXYA2_FULL_40_8]